MSRNDRVLTRVIAEAEGKASIRIEDGDRNHILWMIEAPRALYYSFFAPGNVRVDSSIIERVAAADGLLLRQSSRFDTLYSIIINVTKAVQDGATSCSHGEDSGLRSYRQMCSFSILLGANAEIDERGCS